MSRSLILVTGGAGFIGSNIVLELANTGARLRELYGEAQALELGRPPEGGFRVKVVIPYRERSLVAAVS